ncbi:MAG: transposase [Draconibacterium sp.]|nr:transposase [Draconibacterium sp.]
MVKVEANSFGTNVRYITSNLKAVRAKALYELGYCARGAASELRIKEHKTYLLSGRMSCNSFMANQFRLFLHSAAYVLIHALQTEMLKGTKYCKATMKAIQLKIIKVAAKVNFMKTKVKIELPREFLTAPEFKKYFNMFEVLRI